MSERNCYISFWQNELLARMCASANNFCLYCAVSSSFIFSSACRKGDSENGAWLSRKYLVAANIPVVIKRRRKTMVHLRFAMYGYAGSYRETMCGFRHVWYQCGLSQRVKGPVSVAILLLQVRRGAVLLIDIGVSSAHWGGTILNDLRDFTSHFPLSRNIGLQWFSIMSNGTHPPSLRKTTLIMHTSPSFKLNIIIVFLKEISAHAIIWNIPQNSCMQ